MRKAHRASCAGRLRGRKVHFSSIHGAARPRRANADRPFKRFSPYATAAGLRLACRPGRQTREPVHPPWQALCKRKRTAGPAPTIRTSNRSSFVIRLVVQSSSFSLPVPKKYAGGRLDLLTPSTRSVENQNQTKSRITQTTQPKVKL